MPILSQSKSVLRQEGYIEACARTALLTIDNVRDDLIRKRNTSEYNLNNADKQQLGDKQVVAKHLELLTMWFDDLCCSSDGVKWHSCTMRQATAVGY